MPMFFPDGSREHEYRIAHMETFLARAFSSRVARSADPSLLTMTSGSALPGGGSSVPGSGGGGGASILGGDVAGPPVANTVAALQGHTLTLGTPSTGQVLSWNGTAWVNTVTIAGPLTVTGTLTCAAITASNTATITAPALGRCLTLNSDAGATIFMNPKSGTQRMNVRWGGIYQLLSDFANNGTGDFGVQNIQTGNVVLYCTATDQITLGSTNGAGGAILGVAGGLAGFYGVGTPVAKPTVTGSRGANAALASLLTALASQGLLTDSST